MGDVSEGLPGTDGLTSTVSFEVYNQEKVGGREEGKLFVGKKITSIKVTVWSTQEMS